MCKTKHINKRMSQRCINQGMLDLVKVFGVQIENGDKTIFNKKSIDQALVELNRMSKLMQRMSNKGGIILVEDQGVEITAYALNRTK